MAGSIATRRLFYLTLLLSILVAVASAAGVVFESTIYVDAALSYRAQGVGQDLFDLLVIAPLLGLTAFGIRRQSRSALLVWSGLVTYTAYSFVLYCFTVHFNALFLVYTATLGVSVYLLIDYLMSIDPPLVKSWFDAAPLRPLAIYLFFAAAFFYFAWLSEIIPALLTGTTPPTVLQDGQMTHPVAVLDIALLLPLFILSGIKLLRRRPIGYVLAPMSIGFATYMAAAIIAMVISMAGRGLAELSELGLFVPLLLMAGGLLIFTVRHLAPFGEH